MNEARDIVTLWRPVGPAELKFIEASGMRAFPPRLPDQPIFYPVLTEAYATQIARDWNVPARSFLDRYPVEHAGSRQHLEYWIPAEDLEAFNEAIVGSIEVTATFGEAAERPA